MDSNEPEKIEAGGAAVPPEPAAKTARPAGRGRVLAGAVLAIALVSGLYLVNQYWIKPASKTQATNNGDHPEAPRSP